MIAARVLGRDLSTGKIYQAMRGEGDARRWRWIEVTHESDCVETRGDVVFSFPTMAMFPMTPPAKSNASDGG